MIELKYAATTFGRMQEEERALHAHSLLLKIHTVTGWTIPVSDELINIMVDQFQKKLNEAYHNVNPEEIEYAFRNRSLDIKDWGKALNLTMIDEILLPYLSARRELSAAEESMAHKINFIEDDFQKELTDEEWEEWLKDMVNYKVNLLPCAAYEYLVKKELLHLSAEEKNEYLSRAKSVMVSSIEAGTKEMLDFLKMKDANHYTASVKASLITISKRLAIHDYLQKKFITNGIQTEHLPNAE